MKPTTIADALLPGTGLIVDGRLAWGIPLLVPAVLLLSALLLAVMLGGFLAAWVAPRGLPAYLILSLCALVIRHRLAARERFDPTQAKQLARAAASAWLRDDGDATAKARLVTRVAPDLPQAWHLLALVSGDAQATRRAKRIEARNR